MPGPRSWRPLPLAVPGIPSLLVCTDFTPQSYSVRITDLANLWTESLEKKPIIMRGLKEDTSIDPTDGPDQIRKLLDLLRAAFDPTSPEHGDTSMALSRGGSGDAGDDGLVIHITVILPGGLRPLKWPMHLKKSTQSAIATDLVLPLIQAHHARTREMTELVAALRDKDSVITKLVDKLEAVGTGLEHTFTSLSGRRKVTRAIAEERVKGLAPFREADFRKRAVAAKTEAGPADIPVLLDDVFGGDGGLACGADLDIDDSPALNDWWVKLGKGKHIALVERGKEKTSKKTESPPPLVRTRRKADTDDDDDDDDDDFQVQATPPGLTTRKRDKSTRRPQAPPSAADDDDDETSDGEDGDGAKIPDSMPEPPSQQRTRHATDAKPSASRLGAIGKRMKPAPKTRTPSPPPPPPAQPVRQDDDDDDDDGSATASDVDDDENSPPPPPPPPPKTPPRRGALGRIGGAGARAQAGPSSAPAAKGREEEKDGDGDTAAAVTTPRTRGRLGVIGRRGGGAAAADGDGEKEAEKRGRGGTPVATAAKEEEEEERPRETSRERADRKRAELQGELQKRAGAGPARKKRKF
ncbi:XLF-domain-containing protein [Phialemonium atrogriseum]|uniref:Non-homologous end-joining factor 1 n=1 Tax=Phialemonium atrogriseum TaxID=1093897 RepID=A0AAJ0FJI2_9PEZI|nr:XLF-domain-containing protein [Phialemonium atrogriseum]KAK1763140.1 XLF-domain-containing protein [Phialemonium atrogriseum]